MKETEYDSLGSIEAIRKRPGMYIGEPESPDQLTTEAIDNMLDEIANGHANRCSIEVTNNKQCWVLDNGSGIKSYDMTLSDGRVENSIIALCSVLHTGSKFDNEDYKTLIGMNGVGLVAINALSNWLVIRTRDRDNRTKVHEFIFQNSEFVNNNIYENIEDDGSWSTIVGFQANPEHFESDEYNIEKIRNRLILSQSKFNNADFYLNDEQIEKYPFDEYVRNCLDLEKSDKLFRLYYGNQKESVEVLITYTNDFDVNILGDVNLRTCDGTYLTSFQTLLKKLIAEKLDKKFKKVSDSLLTLGLKLYISLTIPEPRFDSQTKTRMTLNVREELIVPLTNQINWLLGQGVLDIIQYNIENKLKKSIVPKQTASKKMISAENKLRDCVKIPGDVLYIVEGESALGTIKQIRNSKTEAIFPVKGKVLNVESASVDKIKNNKEVSDLLEALGPKDKRRYKKVKLLMDADSVSAESVIYYVDENDYIDYNQIQNMTNINHNCHVESLNQETCEKELKRINRVISHKYSKDYIWRFKLVGGQTEDFTDDHVIYTWNKFTEMDEEKSPTDIDINSDYLIIPKKQLTVNKDIEIDIIDNIINVLRKNNNTYIKINIEDFNWDTEDARIDISKRIDFGNYSRAKLSRMIGVNPSNMQMYDTGRDNTFTPVNVVEKLFDYVNIDLEKTVVKIKINDSTKYYAKKGEILNQYGKFRNVLEIDENIAYLVGQYIGDGNYGSSRNNPYETYFNVGDGRYSSYVLKAFKDSGYNNYVIQENKEYNSFSIKLKSIEFQAILNHLGLTRDKHNRYKFIPRLLFSTKENIRKSLLKGLYHSDGSFFKKQNSYRFSYSTNSEQLKLDVCFLLRQFGITPVVLRIKKADAYLNQKGVQIKASKDSYNVVVNKSNDLDLISEIFEDKYIKTQVRKPNNGLLINLNDDFDAVKIKSLEKVPYNYNVVYDLEIQDNNNFPVGVTGNIVHNSDGAHISVLLITLFNKFAPDMIKEGRISIIYPPLYGVTIKKKFIPIYNFEDTKQYSNHHIMRFKGLGEMNSSQLKHVIDSKMEYILEYPGEKKANFLMDLIRNSEYKRKLVQDDRCVTEKILEKILEKNKQGLLV